MKELKHFGFEGTLSEVKSLMYTAKLFGWRMQADLSELHNGEVKSYIYFNSNSKSSDDPLFDDYVHEDLKEGHFWFPSSITDPLSYTDCIQQLSRIGEIINYQETIYSGDVKTVINRNSVIFDNNMMDSKIELSFEELEDVYLRMESLRK